MGSRRGELTEGSVDGDALVTDMSFVSVDFGVRARHGG